MISKMDIVLASLVDCSQSFIVEFIDCWQGECDHTHNVCDGQRLHDVVELILSLVPWPLNHGATSEAILLWLRGQACLLHEFDMLYKDQMQVVWFYTNSIESNDKV